MTRLAASTSIAVVAAAGWVVVAAGASVVQTAYGLRRFGGVEFVPRVVGLQIVREWGGWAAAVATCFVVTAILHGRLQPDDTIEAAHRESARRFAVIAGAAVPLLYVPVSLVAILGAMLAGHFWLRLPPASFFEATSLSDVKAGFLHAAFFAAVPAAWSSVGHRVWGTKRSLGFKLVATHFTLFALTIAWDVAVSLVEWGTQA